MHGRYAVIRADPKGAFSCEYVWLGLLPVAFVDWSSGSPVTYFVHADQVMTPQKLTDALGAVVWDRVQDPFGVEVSATGSLTLPSRFPGQIADIETSFNQNWHRDYDPSLGRYIQSDPIGLMGGVNTYAYVEGNPLTRVDVMGLWPVPEGQLGHGNIFGPGILNARVVSDTNEGIFCTCGNVPAGADADLFMTPGFPWTKIIDGDVYIPEKPSPAFIDPSGRGGFNPPQNYHGNGGNNFLNMTFSMQKNTGALWWLYGKLKNERGPQRYMDDLNDGTTPSVGDSCIGFFD